MSDTSRYDTYISKETVECRTSIQKCVAAVAFKLAYAVMVLTVRTPVLTLWSLLSARHVLLSTNDWHTA